MAYARIEIAPSILASDFSRLADEIRKVTEGGADVLHVDVMDGHFVPNISIGIPVVASLRKATRLPLDVHLMIERPEEYIEEFVQAGRTRRRSGCRDQSGDARGNARRNSGSRGYGAGDERESRVRRAEIYFRLD
jgi:hypothetical protein